MHEEINFGCSEEFAELCALSTSASLSSSEEDRLEAHVAVCAQCALLLNQYRTLASDGMATLAAMRAHEPTEEKLPNAEHIKRKLLSALAPLQVAHGSSGLRENKFPMLRLMPLLRVPAMGAMAAGVILAATVGYIAGIGHTNRKTQSLMALSAGTEATLKGQLTNAESQLASSKEALFTTSQTADSLQTQFEKTQKDLNDLENAKMGLEARIQALASDNQRQNTTVAALTAERDALVQKLRDSDSLLQSVRLQLKATQDDRQRVLLRTASLETQVNQLSAEVRENDDAARRSEQYLASDRDVRELMGARQLYIADVFDVDPQGETRKPFGRVFYTKGKSLIFYAFDLDHRAGYKEAKAFQAWGRPGSSQAAPVSLGIFYLDNEKNRRWALKFDDPKVLDEINSLFVTVEPKGGSKRPTNKPFLLAYLHTATPNHP